MSSNEQGGRDWKDISSKRNSTRKALEVRSSESEPEGIWYSWNMREGGIGRVKKWTEMRPPVEEFRQHPAVGGHY